MKLARIAVTAIIATGTFGVSTAGASMGVPLSTPNWSGYLAQARPGYKINYTYTYFKVPTLDCGKEGRRHISGGPGTTHRHPHSTTQTRAAMPN